MCYLSKIIKWTRGESSLPEWKIYEYAVALKLNMLVWKDFSTEQDYGVDCVGKNKTAQVKYYNGSTITWKTLSTYIAYSTQILNIMDMCLVTTRNAKVSKIILNKFPNIIRVDLHEIISELQVWKANIEIIKDDLKLNNSYKYLICTLWDDETIAELDRLGIYQVSVCKKYINQPNYRYIFNKMHQNHYLKN